MLLDDKKGKWADLLPEAVWALNTTECRATGFIPFRLLYGSEVSAFRPRGVPGPTSKLSPRAPAQMGRRETEREGGKARGRQA
jgi:hypothetical protein